MAGPQTAPTPLRTVIWRRHQDNASLEYAVLSRLEAGYEITGDIVSAHAGEPLRVVYRLQCGLDWRSRLLSLEQHRGARESVTLSLGVDPRGGWAVNGRRAESLAHCVDIDLGLSPSTNALPINRLRLSVGEKAEIAAVWVRFPDLEVVPARQSYERRGERTYHYASPASGFHADIQVDEFGLPVLYQDIWERIAEQR